MPPIPIMPKSLPQDPCREQGSMIQGTGGGRFLYRYGVLEQWEWGNNHHISQIINRGSNIVCIIIILVVING